MKLTSLRYTVHTQNALLMSPMNPDLQMKECSMLEGWVHSPPDLLRPLNVSSYPQPEGGRAWSVTQPHAELNPTICCMATHLFFFPPLLISAFLPLV